MKQTTLCKEFVIKSSTKDGMYISGYASVFNVIDSHNDIVLKGAFGNILRKNNVKFLWQHDQTRPIGVVQSLTEDEYGLYMEATITPYTQQGLEAIALLEQGALNGLSVGFITKDFKYNDKGIREIVLADLHEISLVTFPANEEAQVTLIDAAFDKASRALSKLINAS